MRYFAEGEIMIQDFKKFIMRGNMLDLAVAVVVGAAFVAIVNALVEDLITPLIAAFGGKRDFSGLLFTINGSKFMYGNFINAVVAFLIVAAVVFFLVLVPVNKLRERAIKEELDPDMKKCPECLSDVPKEARRCAFCTSEIGSEA
jgi:large conductance mechanosensitive channel